ncbi:MAG: TonB-dependent receptor [Flavobacteriaceae bacterium]|nr:TonB-dependent receptor [Flavobacteriaceae bacterium]
MKFLRHLSSFLILSLSILASGQEILIVDEASELPLEGVALYNKSKTNATITNENGVANLSVFTAGETVFVQYYGYKNRSFEMKNESSNYPFQFALQSENQNLEEVILSIARNASTRKQIAEKVSVISTKEILAQRPATGADLISLSPGVRIQKSQGGGGSPVIRGFEANRLLLVVDGVRMNNAIYRSGHLQNAITIHPNIVERVEVIFGSSSVGYGSDALGGVIHYYTRNPLINSKEKVKTQFSSDFSSANTSSINSISTEVSFKKWASLTSLSHSGFGDIRMGENRNHGYESWGMTPYYSMNNRNTYSPLPIENQNPLIQKNTGYNQFDLLQKFLFQVGGRNQLVLNLQYSKSSDISRYDKLAEEKNNSLRYAEWYYGPQKRFLFSPQLKIFPEKKYLNSGKITFALQNLEESRVNRFFNSFTRNHQTEKINALSLNGDFEFKHKENTSFSYGFEGIYNDVSSFAFKNDLLLQQNQIIGYTPRLPIPTRYPSRGSSYVSYAVYLNWIWNVTSQLTLNAGLRLTKTHLDGSWKEFYNINALLSEVNLDSEALTGTLALTYRPNKVTQLNAIISNGFRNPNIDDIGKIRESKGNLVVPNPFLYPEYAYNFELGITHYLPKAENYFSIRGFSTLISRHIGRADYIIFADKTTPNLNTILYNGEELYTLANDNLGNRYLFGASLDGNFSLSRNFSLKGDLSIIEALKNDQYGPLPSISPIFGSLSLNYQKNNWFSSLRFQFSGSKDPEDYSTGGEDGLEETPLISISQGLYGGTPSWSELSFLTQYQLNKNVFLRLGIDNIFDVHYRSFASGISAPGRNFKLGFNVSF